MPDADAVNLALLGLRLILGAVILAHGINHIIGGGKIAGTGRWFESLGMKPGPLHAWLASITEVAGGALLVLGLLTPLAWAAVVGVMLVALITNHRKNGFFIFRPGEGYEYVLTLTVVALCLAALGGGEWSLDHALDRWDDLSGWTGLAIAAVAGGGGAALLLAVFWRPEPKPDAA
ncbi:MAG TPA: DoxX family protein [Acidimicrobiales bacterium]|nr:DoxX family protein [Acidimicrobiales bacterium]